MMDLDLDAIRSAVAVSVRDLRAGNAADRPQLPAKAEAKPGGTRRKPDAPAVASAAGSEVVVPVRIASDADAAALVRMVLAICADDSLRVKAITGQLRIDARVSASPSRTSYSPVSCGNVPRLQRAAPMGDSEALEENVITEAVLRRKAKPGQRLSIRNGAILTPSAQDYARSHRISLERSTG